MVGLKQTIYRTPRLTPDEDRARRRIGEIWRALKFSLKSRPHAWEGLLLRSWRARGIQGSNAIEGHHVSRDDALAAVEGGEPMEASEEDKAAVTGYQNAMTFVLQTAGDPHSRIDESLVRSLHFMLAGYDLSKRPGAWREGAVGVVNQATGERVYEAPDVDEVPDLMRCLVVRINDQADTDSALVRAAMAHLNLVMIHPFKDGNGRMARVLQSLVLASGGLYDPTFCSVEEYLGRNVHDYYAILGEVGQGSWQPANDARPWIRFMLQAHYRQAVTLRRRTQETGEVWDEISRLTGDMKLPERSGVSLVNAAFGWRLTNGRYRLHADVSASLASRDLKALVDADLLVASGAKRGTTYAAAERLLQIREKHRLDRSPISSVFDD